MNIWKKLGKRNNMLYDLTGVRGDNKGLKNFWLSKSRERRVEREYNEKILKLARMVTKSIQGGN